MLKREVVGKVQLLTSAAKAVGEATQLISALKRCATPNQPSSACLGEKDSS